MSKAGRIKLGKEWKRKLEENAKGAKHVIPRQVSMNHPYILEAEGKLPKAEPKKDLPKKSGVKK